MHLTKLGFLTNERNQLLPSVDRSRVSANPAPVAGKTEAGARKHEQSVFRQRGWFGGADAGAAAGDEEDDDGVNTRSLLRTKKREESLIKAKRQARPRALRTM
jgi:hypothetical protein